MICAVQHGKFEAFEEICPGSLKRAKKQAIIMVSQVLRDLRVGQQSKMVQKTVL